MELQIQNKQGEGVVEVLGEEGLYNNQEQS